MGMVLGLTTLSDDNIARLLADPPLVWRIVAPDDPDIYEDASREQAKPSFLGGLFGRKGAPPPPAPELALRESEGITTDLDKAWHGIHYLFTGTGDGGDPPLAFLMAGGREVGDIEVGYGPARVFSAEETRAIMDALAVRTDDEILSRFDPPDMLAREIYPEIWDRTPPTDDPAGYLQEYLRILRGFLQQAVEAKMGIVVSLT